MGDDDYDDLDLATLPDDELVKQMHDDLYDGLAAEIVEGTTILLDRGWGPDKVLNDALVEGMRIVGIDFRDGILFVPEVLLAANAMKAGMEILRPLLAETGAEPIGKIVIGTVKGDIHDIGKNLVAMMMEGAGFEVIDLGINCDVDKYLAALEQHQPDILGMSALLTTTMPYMKVVIDTLGEKDLRDHYIVLCGGAPLNEEFGQAIGADAYCRDAAVAAETAKELVDGPASLRGRRAARARPSGADRRGEAARDRLRCARQRPARRARANSGSTDTVEIRYLPAPHHSRPERIVPAIREQLAVDDDGERPLVVRLRRLRHRWPPRPAARRDRRARGAPAGRPLLRVHGRLASCSRRCTRRSPAPSTSPTSSPSTSTRSCGDRSGSTAIPSCATRTSATTGASCCSRRPTTRRSSRPAAGRPRCSGSSSSTSTSAAQPFADGGRRSACSGGSPDAAPRARRQRGRHHLLARHPRPGQRPERARAAPGAAVVASSSVPSTAPSARPASTPPRKTSPSGAARARPCDDHVLAGRGAGRGARGRVLEGVPRQARLRRRVRRRHVRATTSTATS